MHSKLTKRHLAVAVIFLAAITMAGGVQWAKSSVGSHVSQETKKQKLLKEEVFRVIDAAPDEFDANKRQARAKKNRRFNMSAGRLEDQKEDDIYGTILESEPPALPLGSDVIVVASIQWRQPYLSENITSVYTELTVHIEEILKNNPASPIYAFEPLFVDREGGAIRMPNGRIYRYSVAGLDMPVVGKRYVLFLQYVAEHDYKLVSGYELTASTIKPLENFHDRDWLLKLTEVQFLDLLRQRLSQKKAEGVTK
jgi:hypothetical protein